MTQTADITKTILDLEDRRLAAMVAADVETLDGILADDLSYVHTTAAIDTKESLTSGLASGRLDYESITSRRAGLSGRMATARSSGGRRTSTSTETTSRWSSP